MPSSIVACRVYTLETISTGSKEAVAVGVIAMVMRVDARGRTVLPGRRLARPALNAFA